MARVEEARESLLRRRGEECARRVEEAKRRAGRVKREREQVARIAGKEMVQRLESAERRRGELLLAKRARVSPTRRNAPEGQIRSAAVKIQRAWRAYRTARAIREFRAQGVSVEAVTQRSFEEVVVKFKAPATIRAAGRLFTVLALITSDVPEKESTSLVRTFLSAYMIMGHTKEVLHSHDQPLELVPPHSTLPNSNVLSQDLTTKTKTFLRSLESYLTHPSTPPPPTLKSEWESFLAAFRQWKTHDASILVDMLITKFVELDIMLLDIQDSPAMASVVSEYTEAIKSGQRLLLAKIKRLRGAEETKGIVKRAVQASRRRRAAAALQQQQHSQTVQVGQEDTTEEETAIGELIEPPSSESTGLSNRRIMHELSLDPNYQFSLPEKSPEQNSREYVKQQFFEALRLTLKNNDQSLLPSLIADIKSRLLTLLPPSSPSHATLQSHLDETLVAQQCAHNIFDTVGFLTYVQNMMKALCAPVRDAEVAALETLGGEGDTDRFVVRVERTIEMLGVMALDSANFHFNLARPALVAQALVYERTKFAEDVASGRVKLSRTRKWIENNVDGNESLMVMGVFHRAFVNLLFTTEEIPETFPFDAERIATLRTQIQETITLTALILLSKTFTAGANSRTLDFSTLARRLKILLHESPENILAEIERFIGPSTPRPTLLNMIRRIKSDAARDPCVLLLQKRLKAVLVRVLSRGNVGTLVAVGLGEVEG